MEGMQSEGDMKTIVKANDSTQLVKNLPSMHKAQKVGHGGYTYNVSPWEEEAGQSRV